MNPDPEPRAPEADASRPNPGAAPESLPSGPADPAPSPAAGARSIWSYLLLVSPGILLPLALGILAHSERSIGGPGMGDRGAAVALAVVVGLAASTLVVAFVGANRTVVRPSDRPGAWLAVFVGILLLNGILMFGGCVMVFSS